MRVLLTFSVALLLGGVAAAADDFDRQKLDNWHQWRGPNSDGLAVRGAPPVRWDEKTNIKWKTPLLGTGSASPIIWGKRIYVISSVSTNRTKPKPGAARTSKADPPASRGGGRSRGGFGGFLSSGPPSTIQQFGVACLDRDTGKMIWKKLARELIPHEGHHRSHGYASASPVTDGKRLYASFGSYGVFCYDMDGKELWWRDLGNMRTRMGFGEGASPALHGDSLVINWDHEGQSSLVCLDANTGQERWRVDRNESTTWTTPLIAERKGAMQVIVNGSNRTRGYDLKDGRLIWSCGGQVRNPIASPFAHEGVAYCMTGYRGYALYAISLDARGDVTGGDAVVWKRTDVGPYVATGVRYGNLIYVTKGRTGILSCLDAKTGRDRYANKRLPGIGTLYASLTGANGHIYIPGRDGVTVVLKHGPKFQVVAENRLDEGMDASPAFAGNEIFLRGPRHLYCITAK